MSRILLIDDTPEIAELLTFALRDHGHEVFAEGYTDTVNELIRQFRADALVLDCTAFDMSESLFDIVRHHPNHAELPVVIISDTRRASPESVAWITMPLWSMDQWQYLEREVVTDARGRQWTVGLMDVLGQEGDSDIPNRLLELQYSSGRYFALIYSASGALQWERGYSSLPEATRAFEDLRIAVIDGSLDPSQPVFRQDLED
ncbi:MAG: hypothetical protein DMG39_22460 [Acidobacteria bacterium]|nr:MAG: hypothetical protein DMG39_22460 [Acidobacteriota bacterium]